jgi:uncharacterized RDD family membrane protein YckC
MKCPACGYVSFDDLEECKKCGGPLHSLDREPEKENVSLLQEELFSPRLDEETLAEEEAGASPVMGDGLDDEEEQPAPSGEDNDFFPDQDSPVSVTASADRPATGEPPGFPAAEEEIPATVPPAGPMPIIDDDSEIPEDLWVEEGAGFFTRLQALAVDLSILGGVLLLFLFSALLVLSTSGYGWTKLKTPEGVSALFLPFYLLGLFLSLSYFTFFLGRNGRTPGKALLKLDVRRTDGGEMTYTRGFLRGVGYLVSLTFAGLGFLWIVFDERKRGWHDYLSGTWVKDLKSGG